MYYNDNIDLDEREISIFDMMMYLLRRYRSIILVGVICALVVCAGAFVKTKFIISDSDYEKYERDMTVYNADQNLLKSYNDKLVEAKNYLVESPLIDAESYKLPTATVSLCVESLNEKSSNTSTNYDPGDSIINNIVLTIDKSDKWQDIADKYGVNSKYVKELISVEPDFDSNIVVLNTFGKDEISANSLLDDIRALVNNSLSSILESYKGYSVIERNHSVYLDTAWVNDIGVDTEANINEYINQITALENKYKNSGEPKEPGYFSVMRGVKYILIGGVVGVVIMCVWYCLKYLLSDSIHTDDEIHDLCGFTNLGTFSVAEDGKNGIDKFLISKQYGEVQEDTYVYDRIAESINLLAKDREEVLLIGTADKEKLVKLEAELNKLVENTKIVSGGNLNTDNEALSKLKGTDSVVLVEERNVSKIKEVVKEVEFIRNCDKRILGYIQY